MAATHNAKDSQLARFPEVIDVKLPNIRGSNMKKGIQKNKSDAELPAGGTASPSLKMPPPFDRTNSKKIDYTDAKGEASPGRVNHQMSI